MHDTTISTPTATNQPVQHFPHSGFQSTATAVAAEPKISVHCDICSEQDFGTAFALENRGWGIYPDFSFCPTHEEMA